MALVRTPPTATAETADNTLHRDVSFDVKVGVNPYSVLVINSNCTLRVDGRERSCLRGADHRRLGRAGRRHLRGEDGGHVGGGLLNLLLLVGRVLGDEVVDSAQVVAFVSHNALLDVVSGQGRGRHARGTNLTQKK